MTWLLVMMRPRSASNTTPEPDLRPSSPARRDAPGLREVRSVAARLTSMATTAGAISFTTVARLDTLATSATTGSGTPARASDAASARPRARAAPRWITKSARRPDVKEPGVLFMAVFPLCPAAAAEPHHQHATLCRPRL
jgi:hypothetical protein